MSAPAAAAAVDQDRPWTEGLSRAYHKPGIKARAELEAALAEAVPPDGPNDRGADPDAGVPAAG
jgi:hypothetical protein